MAFTYSLGADEIRGKPGTNLYKAVFAEFFGIFILNFFGCAACTQSNGDFVLISLAFGLSVFMAAMVIITFIKCISNQNGLKKVYHFYG